MTDTNNEWIEKAQDEFIALVMSWIDTEESFKTAIEDNLPEHYKMLDQIRWGIELNEKFKYEVIPQSISREAVEKLREKRGNHTNRDVESRWHNIEEIIRDLDQLLSPTNPQDDTN